MSLAAEVRMKGFGCCLKLKVVGNPIVVVVLVGYTDVLLKTLPVLTRPDALLLDTSAYNQTQNTSGGSRYLCL